VEDVNHADHWRDRRSAGFFGDYVGSIRVGSILNAVLAFMVTAFVIYLVVVVPMNRLTERARRQTEVAAPPALTKEEFLLTEIRDELRRQ
jgi:large conductance mechanosensitive channel